MSREIEDFLNTLDDWTLYLERGDSMPYATLKLGTAMNNILQECSCFDGGDLDSIQNKGFCVFSEKQVELAESFIKSIGVGQIKYEDTQFWHELLRLEQIIDEEY